MKQGDQLPSIESGQLGYPEYTIPGTSVPLFDAKAAQDAGAALARMQTAVKECKRGDWEAAEHAYFEAFKERAAVSGGTAPGAPRDDVTRGRAHADVNTAIKYVHDSPDFPHYPKPCPPGSSAMLQPFNGFNIFLLGGGLVPPNNTGNVTGVDTFFGSGMFLIDDRARGGASTTVPFVGGRVRATWNGESTWDYVLGRHKDKTSPQPPLVERWTGSRWEAYVESGVQSGFGAQSFIQTFQGVSGTPQGFGSNTVKENFQVPILIGFGVPITSPGSTPAFLDFYGGITLDSWTQTLQGRDAGAPGGGGFFNQNNRFTVDPTIGGGVRVAVGDINGDGIPDIIVGGNVEVQFRPGSVVTAGSPNFPSETYYGTVYPQTNFLFMFRVGIPIGGR